MKLPHRRQFLHLAAGAATLPAMLRVAGAQPYPARPVRIIVGFPPGFAADAVARLIAQSLSDSLGQQFVVENRPGAGSNIATDAVGRATPMAIHSSCSRSQMRSTRRFTKISVSISSATSPR